MAHPAQIRDFVIAAHGNLPVVKAMLAQDFSLLDAAHEWSPGSTETAIQAAAHTGGHEIAEFLLAHGAPLRMCTAASLGRAEQVRAILQAHPEAIHARGAHAIPLLPHAAFSGDAELVAFLYKQGATEGAEAALANAAAAGHLAVVRWLLENADPDLNWKNQQGRTALDIAQARGQQATADLLRSHGAESGQAGPAAAG